MGTIENIKLNDILDRAISRLAVFGVSDVLDVLAVDDKLDGLQVIMNIMKDTISAFDYYEPQDILIRPYLKPNTSYTFVDNFKEYLEGKISRESMIIVPRSIVQVNNAYHGTKRGINYEPPTLVSIFWSGFVSMRVIVNRPYVMEREGNEFTKDSAIYYLSEYSAPRLLRFRQLFLLNLMTHLVTINENMEHMNLPIAVFNGLSNRRSELESKVMNDFELSHGYFAAYPK